MAVAYFTKAILSSFLSCGVCSRVLSLCVAVAPTTASFMDSHFLGSISSLLGLFKRNFPTQ